MTISRTGFIKPAAAALIALGGLACGFYLSRDSAPADTTAPTPPPKTPSVRFPLTTFDVKETAEAPQLAADPAGRVYLVFPSKTADDRKIFRLATSDDSGRTFSEPRTIAESGIFKAVSQMRGKTIAREVRMAPHVAASASQVHVAWTETLPKNDGVRMALASSTDRGTTFGPPRSIHQGDAARATYTALALGRDGSLLCSWLDNRNKSQQTFAAFRPASSESFEPETVVHSGEGDKGVCPCCPTASLLAPDGTAYVAFRNIENGYRDIAIGRKKPGDASYELFRIVPPTWTFNGCPHDGPSMAIQGDSLHIVWMDAHTGSPRCYHAWAKLGDAKFESRELNAIAVGSQGNAKLFADVGGNLHAVWEQSDDAPAAPAPKGEHSHEPAPAAGSGRAIWHAVLPPGASDFTVARPIAPRTGAFQTRPSVVVLPTGDVIAAWNELDESGKAVVVSRVEPRSDSR